MSNQLEIDCKKYLGLPPYNDNTNICYKDGYFIHSLFEKYGKDETLKYLNKLYQEIGE